MGRQVSMRTGRVDPRPAVGVKVHEITARESQLSWLHHWRTSGVGSPGLAIMWHPPVLRCWGRAALGRVRGKAIRRAWVLYVKSCG